MNIFYLHPNPKTCALFHCDKHINKMMLEYTQILSTAHRLISGDDYCEKNGISYSKAFENHPSTVWARTSTSNYAWLYNLYCWVHTEWVRRHNKTVSHSCFQFWDQLSVIPNIENKKWSQPPQCMPDEYKQDDSMLAYRAYYLGEKMYMAKWKNTPIPDWIPEEKLCF